MLYEGKLIADGTPDDFRNSSDERVRRFVLGEASEQELASLKMQPTVRAGEKR
jgi:ABC-type transporter Mla maintaining outer membrane lipid asymmetry ATPase subunit MlaF